MIKGERLDLFGHNMEVVLRKETLSVDDGIPKDMVIYDLACVCHTYPFQLTIEGVTEEVLNLMSLASYNTEN